MLPAGLELLQEDAAIVEPLLLDPSADDYRKARYLKVIGRVRDGVTVGEAAAEARAIAARWAPEQDWAEDTVRQATAVPLREHLVRDSRPLLLVLTGAVSLLLLVATANVVHLLLAGRLARAKELAVRAALGASSGRVARLFVTESLLLGVCGGATGLLLASLLVPVIVSVAPFELPRLPSVELGSTAIGFSLLLGIVTSMVGGLVAALVQQPAERSLREEGRGTTAPAGRDRLRRVLVAAEVALSMVVLLGAALLVKSFWHLTEVDPGFEPRNLFSATLLPLGEATAEGAGPSLAFYELLVERVDGLAGVDSAALVHTLPITGGGWVMDAFAENGVGNTQQAVVVRTRAEPAAVGPAVLRTLREAEPALAVVDPATLEQRLSSSLTEPRITAVALVLFAATAVILAVIGLVGIVSRSVAERAPEIALRRVLGAEGRELLRLVLARSLLPVAVGLLVGVAAGLAAARTLGGLLFEVRPSDPWALGAAVGLLGVAALLAAYLPARRATRIEPASALE